MAETFKLRHFDSEMAVLSRYLKFLNFRATNFVKLRVFKQILSSQILLSNLVISSFNSLQKSHFGRLNLRSYCFGHYPRLMMGTKTNLKTESFALFDNFCFITIEHCKTCITALAFQFRCSVLHLTFHHS